MRAQPHPPSETSASSQGHVLLEALLSLALIGLGALPLAMLGTTWLRWTGEQERLTVALMLAAEQAEVGTLALPVAGGDSRLVSMCQTASTGTSCAPGNRLAVANIERRAWANTTDIAAQPGRLALWVMP